MPPLRLAILNGQVEMAELLKKHGARELPRPAVAMIESGDPYFTERTIAAVHRY